MNLTTLQEFLNQNTIPKIKGRPKTFLGIAKQPHYENVLSNIYAFYFNVNEVHKLKDLFIKSLIDCIDEQVTIQKSKREKHKKDNKIVFKEKIADKDLSQFKEFHIETEYYTKGIGKTKKAGRIDLLLYNDEQAIIIENKVNHHLDNDLDDYWRSVDLDTENTASKIGVLLTLKPISENNYKHFEKSDEYINITHLELLKKVMANLGSYVLGSSEKYLMFLKDFYQNTINLSLSFMEKEDISFYYQNQQKINQLVSFKFKLREHIQNEVKKAGERLKDVKVNTPRSKSYHANRLVYFTSLKNQNLMLTVVYEKLMEENPRMYITIEMWGNQLLKKTNYDVIKNATKEDCKQYFCEGFDSTKENWAHFYKKYYKPSESEIANLSDFILDKIETDSFSSIFKEIENLIKE